MSETIKVLVVDDQEELAKEIKTVVESDSGLEVIGVATDGFSALKKMHERPADVVLLDIRMTNMNGVVATQRIKSEFP